jgi:hypothetical protein
MRVYFLNYETSPYVNARLFTLTRRMGRAFFKGETNKIPDFIKGGGNAPNLNPYDFQVFDYEGDKKLVVCLYDTQEWALETDSAEDILKPLQDNSIWDLIAYTVDQYVPRVAYFHYDSSSNY